MSLQAKKGIGSWTYLLIAIVVSAVGFWLFSYEVNADEVRRASIRTGDADAQSVYIQRSNVSRTYIEGNVALQFPERNQRVEEQSDPVEGVTFVVSKNIASLDDVVSAIANSGNNSVDSGSERKIKYIKLYELGLLQLAAHDLFNVDREIEIDHENGELDLSTLLDHGDEWIELGGEPRNRENVILFSVAALYGEQYVAMLDRGLSESEARVKLIKKYHRELKDLYEKLFNEKLPQPVAGDVTMTENLAFRTIHDLLPGQIKAGGRRTTPVDASLIGVRLSKKELKAKTGRLDGQFDPEFLDIVITIPPDTIIHIDLLERDSSFAEQFSTDHSFEHFMHELEDGAFDATDDVMHYIRSLFAKGIFF